MKLLLRILSFFVGNALGLLAAARFLPDFEIATSWPELGTVTLLLVAGNIFLKPILKLVFTPLILLTLGLFTIIINAGILYLIDFSSVYITIKGLDTLLYGTLIVSITNLLVHWSVKLFIRETEELPISQV
jgi:putative membrane protein